MRDCVVVDGVTPVYYFDGYPLMVAGADFNKANERIKELEAERDALRSENEKFKTQRDESWQAFTRLRRAYSMVRYPTLTEELRLLYDTADAIATGKDEENNESNH